MSFKKEFVISDFSNLIVSIFVIGYHQQGESIVILFRDNANKEVIFSMVVDCFAISSLNMTRKILKKYNVKKLNAVCWTHPHWDHSNGIDKLISNYYSSDIVIFFPKFDYGSLCDDLLKKECKKSPGIFKNIWDLVKNEKNRTEIWRTISASGDQTNVYPMRIKSVNGDINAKDVILYFLTPISDCIDEYLINKEPVKGPNELSVSFVMSIDGYYFFFGADTEGIHAEKIEDSIVDKMRWIKVPHHCSLGAKSIADRLGQKLNFAASTIYATSGLPKVDIQNIYSKKAPLHMTQLPNLTEKKYGIIQYDYFFNQSEISVDVFTYGNAGRYYPNI